MNIKIEGSGIYLEITMKSDARSVSRLLELDGGNYYMKQGDGSPGWWVCQGRVGLPEAIKRSIVMISKELGIL